MDRLAVVFKALSDETRLRIVNLLFTSGELCVCDIERVMGCTQTKVSWHLAYLRKAQLVDGRRRGLWMLCSIAHPRNPEQAEILGFLASLLRSNDLARADAERLAREIRNGCCSTFTIIKPGSIPATLLLEKT